MTRNAKEDLWVVLDLPPDEYAAIETTVEQVSREHGFDEDAIYEACYLIAAAGFDLHSIDGRIWEIAEFAERCACDIETAAEGTASIIHLFEVEPHETADALARVGETIADNPITASDLFTAIEVVGPYALHGDRPDPFGFLLEIVASEARRGASGRELRRQARESVVSSTGIDQEDATNAE